MSDSTDNEECSMTLEKNTTKPNRRCQFCFLRRARWIIKFYTSGLHTYSRYLCNEHSFVAYRNGTTDRELRMKMTEHMWRERPT